MKFTVYITSLAVGPGGLTKVKAQNTSGSKNMEFEYDRDPKNLYIGEELEVSINFQ